jgi:hypothetical protein
MAASATKTMADHPKRMEEEAKVVQVSRAMGFVSITVPFPVFGKMCFGEKCVSVFSHWAEMQT